MCPPTGGRNPISARLTRHFALLGVTPFDDDSMRRVFGTILGGWAERGAAPEVWGGRRSEGRGAFYFLGYGMSSSRVRLLRKFRCVKCLALVLFESWCLWFDLEKERGWGSRRAFGIVPFFQT